MKIFKFSVKWLSTDELKIIDLASDTCVLCGHWEKDTFKTSKDSREQIRIERIAQKGFHFEWKTKYKLISHHNTSNAILSCIKPLKNQWHIQIGDNSFDIYSRLSGVLRILIDGKTLLKETELNSFIMSVENDETLFLQLLGIYIAMIKQHPPTEV